MPQKAVAKFRASAADFWADFSAAQALPVDAAVTFIINVTGRGFDATAVVIQGWYGMNGGGSISRLARWRHAPVAPAKFFAPLSVLRR